MSKPIASLSLDLDNKWSYLKTHGDAGWEAFPSYFNLVVPRVLNVLRAHELTMTVFVVGQDAALERNHAALASIAAAGHEIGNHSFHHEPWLHLYSDDEIERELTETEDRLVEVTGQKPVGFRGPGFSFSPAVLKTLAERGYEYDASTFPTFVGPLARAYYFLTARLTAEQRKERKQLFGTLAEGFRPLRPYWWNTPEGRLLEIPVTTMPVLKAPMHVSYLLYLAQFSRQLALSYFRTGLALCRLTGVAPSLLLHPLDFLGGDDEADLAFFPAMQMPGEEKVEIVHDVLRLFGDAYDVRTMLEHARHAAAELSQTDVQREPAHV